MRIPSIILMLSKFKKVSDFEQMSIKRLSQSRAEETSHLFNSVLRHDRACQVSPMVLLSSANNGFAAELHESEATSL